MLLDGVGTGPGWWDVTAPDHLAVHLRRNLSAPELARVGFAVDVRGTDYVPRFRLRGMEDEMNVPGVAP